MVDIDKAHTSMRKPIFRVADIKPMTVNQCWQGKRYKTKEYKKYERDLMLILPQIKIPDGDLVIELEWGFSYSGCDWDNPIKPFVDILQKKYGFNDSQIVRGIVDKVKVEKGAEYIKWRIYAAQK